MSDSSGSSSNLEQRLNRLENQLGAFEREITELRELLSAREERSAPAPSDPSTPVEPEPISVELPSRPVAASSQAKEGRPLESLVASKGSPATASLDIEALLSGQVLAWVGGLAILVGCLFFLSLAFSRGWIGPEARIIIGLVIGAAMITTGGLFFERRERVFSHTLLATGLGVFNLALFAATDLYTLISFEVALAGTLATAVVGAAIAIRARSQVVAAYGLLPALIAPPLFGADTSGLTIAYLAVLLVGAALIALYRTWTWLPLLSLAFTFFQLFAWLGDSPQAFLAVVIIAGYWLLHTLASGGEDVRKLRDRLRQSSTAAAVFNTSIAAVAGFILLDGSLDHWRGLYLFGLALLHLPMAGYLFYRGSDRQPFGMAMLGLGLATSAIAVPVQFSNEAVPLAWAALAVVMIWLYDRLGNQFSLMTGAAYGLLAFGHFILIDYPVIDFLQVTVEDKVPFFNASGVVLVTLLAAVAASAYLARSKEVYTVAIMISAGLLSYALPYEVTDGWLISGWALVALALFSAHRFEPTSHPVYSLTSLGLTGFALLVALESVSTPSRLVINSMSRVDHLLLWSDASLAMASLAITLTAAWYLHRREYPFIASLILAAAASLVVYLLSIGVVDEFQRRLDGTGNNLDAVRKQAQVGLSILWTTIGVASFATGILLRQKAMRLYGLALLGIAIIKVFIIDLASLDASYRVISFIALGVLLLLASFLYQRTRTGENSDVARAAT